MSIDPSQTVRFQNASGALLLYLLLGAGLLALSVFILAQAAMSPGEGIEGFIIGGISLAFFGFCTAVILRRLRNPDWPSIAIGPDGIRDERITRQTIPWSAITRISTWSSRGSSFVILKIAPEAEAALRLSPLTRLTRLPNRLLGADGLCLNPIGLNIGARELRELVEHYAMAHGAPLDTAPSSPSV